MSGPDEFNQLQFSSLDHDVSALGRTSRVEDSAEFSPNTRPKLKKNKGQFGNRLFIYYLRINTTSFTDAI